MNMEKREAKDEQKKNPQEPLGETPVVRQRSAADEAAGAEEARDLLLRLRADFENTKKRLERDKQEAIRFANEKLLAEILHVADNFDRAMTSLDEGHDPKQVRQGLKLAQDELHKILETHGVQMIQSVGQEFNPTWHEAVGVIEAKGAKEGTIVDEVQKGYLLNGRLIRPSKVRIAGHKD